MIGERGKELIFYLNNAPSAPPAPPCSLCSLCSLCPILFYNLLGFYVMVAFFNIALVKIYEKQHPECGRCSSG